MLPKQLVPLAAAALLIFAPLQMKAQSAAEAANATQSGPKSPGVGQSAAKAMQNAAGSMQAQTTTSAPQAAPVAPQAQAPAPQITETGQNPPESQASAPLRVMVGKSLLITTTDRLRRVSVTDPDVADALVVTPYQVLVHGRSPGEVSLILWDEQERSRSFDLRVDADVSSAAQEVHRIFPEEKIDVSASRNAIVLSGHVATKEDSDRVGLIASAFTKNVVNVLTFGPVGAQEVLLEVKFAEVNRTALTQFGVNILSTGAANTIGQTTTQQYTSINQLQLQDVTCAPAVPSPDITTPVVGPGKSSFQTSTTISDLLNIFLFRPDIHLGAIIKALQGKNLLQILAEPNLIAVNGKESSFLAGGEFPYPVLQSSTAGNAVTIQFKEFGVRLRFTPVIMPNGNIHLRVIPEVSALDFANAVTITGYTMPALSTRRADTEFEIEDGQSFIIAGLMDNRLTNIMNKVPGLGDIPILGNLFRSKSFQKSNTELMVLVTARRISPSNTPPPLPRYPEKFMPPLPDGGK
jgi:pilus assembly protein CpaC